MKDPEFEILRKPFIEYEDKEEDKDPFIPAKEAEPDDRPPLIRVEF